jgi:hypothetical protein
MRSRQLAVFVMVAAVATWCEQGRFASSRVAALRLSTDPWAGAGPCAVAAEEDGRVTLARLLADMVDLERLTRRPAPPYVSRTASSRNRRSDRARRGEKKWYANKDFVSLATGETRTLLDVRGPGVLTRIWSASPAGVLRIYLDGADTPIVEARLARLLRGEVSPFLAPFAFVAEGGHNLYFPIPFARSCKVTLTGAAAGVFFHLGYRVYADETDVEPFGKGALDRARCLRSIVGERLLQLRPRLRAVEAGPSANQLLSSADADSPLVIEAGEQGGMLWQVRVQPGATRPEALRATILAIEFDGAETVRVPLGDFFGSGFGLQQLRSLPVGADTDGAMISRWPMPFRERARISLRGAGGAPAAAVVEVVSGDYTWTDRSLYFHAQWRAPQTFPSKPSRDWNLASITGDGLYVGNVLNVVNRADSWWGEGDERIYVDGESTPSHAGTGTEDYYGYAWCSNQPFTTAFVGHPLSTPRKNFGPLSLYRFHIADPIPFGKALRFDLEVRHWGKPVDVTYDATSFWYARPGSALLGAARDPAAFRLPVVGVPVPLDVPVEPYRCGR